MSYPTCTPAEIASAAHCYRCIPPGSTREVWIYLLCAWLKKGGPSPPPVTDCGTPSNVIEITGAGSADANLTYIQQSNPNLWLPAGGNTNGWFIINNFLCHGEEVFYNAIFFPCTWALGDGGQNPPPVGSYPSPQGHYRPAVFTYSPDTVIVNWDDTNGNFNGNLATFNATADMASVTRLVFSAVAHVLASVSNLGSLPQLSDLDVSEQLLTSLDLTGCSNLTFLDCAQNALTSLDISPCPALDDLFADHQSLTVTSVNTILVTLAANGLQGGQLDLSNQNPSAPPSVGPPNGIAAKAALLATVPAWTVTTD